MPPKKVKVPPKLLTDVSRRSDSRRGPPHLKTGRLLVKVEVFVSSQLFVMAEELPICGPPDWNAPATMSAGVLLFAMSFRAERMYWNRVSLMALALSTAVSVTCSVFSEDV